MTDYIINVDTLAILPKWSEYGELHAKVFELEIIIEVTQSPRHIIENSLAHYGKTYRGAKEGTQAVLGKVSMPPIVLNEVHGIYWFPSISPADDDCFWFALHGIRYRPKVEGSNINIPLINGQNIKYGLCTKLFNKRVQHAQILKSETEQRTNHMKRSSVHLLLN